MDIEREELNESSTVELVDLIELKINDLQRMGVIIAKDPKEKPVVKDPFGVQRPVLQLHSSDSLAKIDLLCDQIRPHAKKYYDLLCEHARQHDEGGNSNSPFRHEQASDRLMGRLKFNID